MVSWRERKKNMTNEEGERERGEIVVVTYLYYYKISLFVSSQPKLFFATSTY